MHDIALALMAVQTQTTEWEYKEATISMMVSNDQNMAGMRSTAWTCRDF